MKASLSKMQKSIGILNFKLPFINKNNNIREVLKEFKLADTDFLETIPLMNEYDNIAEHIRFFIDYK